MWESVRDFRAESGYGFGCGVEKFGVEALCIPIPSVFGKLWLKDCEKLVGETERDGGDE